jgi:Tfp pilus assembly protein PilP
MFCVLAVIPGFSSPELRDFNDSKTLLIDMHIQKHQKNGLRPDHHKNCNKLNFYSVSRQRKTGFLKNIKLHNF